MSHGIAVYLARSALPPLGQVLQALEAASLPLTSSESWDWEADSGWLPMRWRDGESGAEIELGPIGRSEKQALKRAGFVGFDCAVVVTTRGWQSLQSGVCLAAALAAVAGGVVSEDDDEFIPTAGALAWARKSVEAADRAIRREAERDAAVAEMKQSGSVEATFLKMLAQRIGQPIAKVHLMSGRLLVLLADQTRFHGECWTMRPPQGEALEHGHYDMVRGEQMNVLRSDATEAAKSKQVAALEKKLRSAEGKDYKSSSRAETFVGSWVSSTIVSLEHRPGMLRCGLDNGVELELRCGSSQFGVGMSGITFRVGADEVVAN